jgi:acetyl-CoA carboxylase carboxyltransferase component
MDEKTIDELRRRKDRAMKMGGPERIARLKAQGKLTARQRLDLLLDPGSFKEVGLWPIVRMPS